MKRAQSVAGYFHKAKKQYAILREKTQGRPISLLLACITRWGSHMALIVSLLKNRPALLL